MSKSTKKRLKYYRKFIPPPPAEREGEDEGEEKRGAVRLVGVYKFTAHDDDDAFYTRRLHERCLPPPPPPPPPPPRATTTTTTTTTTGLNEGEGVGIMARSSGWGSGKPAAAGRGGREQQPRKRVGNLQKCIQGGGIFTLGEPPGDEDEGEDGDRDRDGSRDLSLAPPVTEEEAAAALRARGFKIFYGGDTEDEWLEQVSPPTTETAETTSSP